MSVHERVCMRFLGIIFVYGLPSLPIPSHARPDARMRAHILEHINIKAHSTLNARENHSSAQSGGKHTPFLSLGFS